MLLSFIIELLLKNVLIYFSMKLFLAKPIRTFYYSLLIIAPEKVSTR
tara:strand:+ start:262 stop:402 length:141 start_codon:yes stop_codon:yes gene_type:complete